jgi:hypothetical protein
MDQGSGSTHWLWASASADHDGNCYDLWPHFSEKMIRENLSPD